ETSKGDSYRSQALYDNFEAAKNQYPSAQTNKEDPETSGNLKTSSRPSYKLRNNRGVKISKDPAPEVLPSDLDAPSRSPNTLAERTSVPEPPNDIAPETGTVSSGGLREAPESIRTFCQNLDKFNVQSCKECLGDIVKIEPGTESCEDSKVIRRSSDKSSLTVASDELAQDVPTSGRRY
ncbi:unnamed protein product, partial [Allacma fusca]